MAEGHRERLMIKYDGFGVGVFADHELIEYLLSMVVPRKDVNLLAHEILERFGSLKGVFQASQRELLSFRNMTKNGARLLSSILPIASRANSAEVAARKSASSPRAIVEFASYQLENSKFEEFYVFAIDGHNRISDIRKLATGTDTSVAFNNIDVVDFAIETKKNKLVIAHNHPVDNAYPSQADIDSTSSLNNALKSLGINLVDHIIVAGNKFFSFHMENLLNNGIFKECTAASVKSSCVLRSLDGLEEK